MARKPKENLLGCVSPVMRTVVLALLKNHAEAKTRATEVVRDIPKADKSGFVVARHLDEALELAVACRRRHRAKPGRGIGGGFCPITFYGVRPSMQTNADDKRSYQRVRLALRLERPILSRVRDVREEAAIPAAKRVMKHGASGGSVFFVHIAPDADYTVETQKVWHGVNKGRDQWARVADTHHITLTPRWLGAVRRIGTATVDRRFIIDAIPFFETAGRSVWTARLARTGRGYQAKVEDGFLSVYGKDVTVHATLRAALNAQPPALAVEIERPIPDEDIEAINLAFA